METDWSALLKAVFGSAYLMSDRVEFSDVLLDSTPGYHPHQLHQPSQPTRPRYPRLSPVTVDRTSAERAWPRRHVIVTSFPVPGSPTPRQSFVETISPWDAVPGRCVDKAVGSERFHYKEALKVCTVVTTVVW